MKYLKTYNESKGRNAKDILKEISEYSYLIEDEGYKIIYFVDVYYSDGDRNCYAIGTSDDIDSKILGLEDNVYLNSVSLDIVDDIPKKKYWGVIENEISNGIMDNWVKSLRIIFPEYMINKSLPKRPQYIEIKTNFTI